MTQAQFINRLKNAYYEYLDYETLLLVLSNHHAELASKYYMMNDENTALLHENISVKLLED